MTIGVVATEAFRKGSIVCDYHGGIITAEEGRKIMESVSTEMGDLFFFKSDRQDLCVDAQTIPCPCHPSLDTVGRRIKHSKKSCNLKPRHCKMKFPDGERHVILFLATKDISVNEELLYDHSWGRKSFLMDGLDLDRFDS